jgi:hypothetical protein
MQQRGGIFSAAHEECMQREVSKQASNYNQKHLQIHQSKLVSSAS